jgi:multimeric flavodoxin WrbA
MKVVTAFVASSRKNGLTFSATRQFLDNLQSFGDVSGAITFLNQYNLGVCRGCKLCFEKGEERCPHKDDRDKLIKKMMDSDGVVFASPNYSFQVSAIMKTLLDRLGFVFHRPCFHGKTFTSIVVQGFFGGGKILKYLRFVGLGLGFNVAKGSCITALEPMAEIERQKMDKTLLKQSKRFHDMLSGPAYPQPSIMQLMVFRGGRTSAKLLAGEENRDHTFYREKGWFESSYYYPARLNPLKKAIGATVDWMTTRMARQKGA